MMVAHPSNFQIMFIGLGNKRKLFMEIDEMVITIIDQVKLLGVIIDSSLSLTMLNLSALKQAEVLVSFPELLRRITHPGSSRSRRKSDRGSTFQFWAWWVRWAWLA